MTDNKPTKGRPPKGGNLTRPPVRTHDEWERVAIEGLTTRERALAMIRYKDLLAKIEQQAAEIARLTAAMQAASQTVHAAPEVAQAMEAEFKAAIDRGDLVTREAYESEAESAEFFHRLWLRKPRK